MDQVAPLLSTPGSTRILVAMVLDRSGSMSGKTVETIDGVNKYVETLRQENGGNDVFFTLTLFSSECDTIYQATPIADVPALTDQTYRPNGYTALFDAVGDTLDAAEASASVLNIDKILIVIMTDGQENSSKRYSFDRLRDRIMTLEKKGNWTFVFLGADLDSCKTAQSLGISSKNSVAYVNSGSGTANVMRAAAVGSVSYCSVQARSSNDNFFAGVSVTDGSGEEFQKTGVLSPDHKVWINNSVKP